MAKRRGSSDGMLVSSKDSYERPKPIFTVTEKDLPQIKQWEVGKKYKLDVEVEMVSHSKGDTYSIGDDNKKHEARLKITRLAAETDKDEDLD